MPFFINIDIHEIQSLEENINKIFENLKIKVAKSDSFDYHSFENFINKLNVTINSLNSEIIQWNEIFKKPQTLTTETIDCNTKLKMDFEKRKISIINQHILNNLFL
jgi:hypothetical protein